MEIQTLSLSGNSTRSHHLNRPTRARIYTHTRHGATPEKKITRGIWLGHLEHELACWLVDITIILPVFSR